jgi:hypothetical protein
MLLRSPIRTESPNELPAALRSMRQSKSNVLSLDGFKRQPTRSSTLAAIRMRRVASPRFRHGRRVDDRPMAARSCLDVDDYEVVAEELSKLAEKWRDLEMRVAEVEKVNARLEDAALTTARALGEVSRHWDAVYDAMRRADKLDKQISSERDHDAARARRDESTD